ncbi:MAG: flagellar basal-body rod protein FlgF [Gammaproteobacteria bacterium]|nr:flagellar basal-body rod protein FlgF [Gammaproteobacteria bacterium]MBU1623806.1 flagellar basal-body rod protein FlgF [Gammaproteobacteria bacterium]MBU1982023.1 flagellar basal-body rod protein FlgF [Gammaproteobacteria bacterium]
MDRLIYTAMTGANHILNQQSTVSNNLANVNTPGFRASIDAFRSVPIQGEGLPTRTFVVDSTVAADFTPGVMQQTGRALDVALDGKGWIAVQDANGNEAYTRNGSLQMSPNGVLQTRSGLTVLGDAGPISIPPDTSVTIAKDGTLSTVPTTNQKNGVIAVGRLKLTNPPEDQMVRGDDGLFRTRDGNPAEADVNVTVVAGSLEGSNVNAVEAMVNMISLARQFDTHMKLLQTANENDKSASTILNLNA